MNNQQCGASGCKKTRLAQLRFCSYAHAFRYWQTYTGDRPDQQKYVLAQIELAQRLVGKRGDQDDEPMPLAEMADTAVVQAATTRANGDTDSAELFDTLASEYVQKQSTHIVKE